MNTDEVLPDRRSPSRVSPSTVLVVDDSVATRRIIGRELRGAGYGVLEAGDGAQAIVVCRTERPDIVLLDVDMPVMDGLSALRELRKDPDLQCIPVLFLTARTGGLDVAAGLDLGAQDYLRKPCDGAELCARVATALRSKAREDLLVRKAQSFDELSSTDPLTGLGNRRRLDDCVDRLTMRHGRESSVSVLMIDIDHFKAVNDRHGHAIGDVVLRIVAARLKGMVSDQQTLVRWGGEEFVVLLVDADDDDAAQLAERMRQSIGESEVSVGGESATLAVTVSVGWSSGPASEFEGVIRAADEALYDAKRAGRNRVLNRPLGEGNR